MHSYLLDQGPQGSAPVDHRIIPGCYLDQFAWFKPECPFFGARPWIRPNPLISEELPQQSSAPEPEYQVTGLEALFTQLTDGVLMYGLDGIPVRVNAAVISAYGFDPTGLPPEEAAARITVAHSDGAPWTAEEFVVYRALRGETVSDIRVKLLTADGRCLYLSISGNPIRSPTGEITGAVVIFHDITEQEHLETENLQQKALLEAIFDTDPGGLAVLAGPDLHFVFVNPAYRYLCPDPLLDPVGQPYDLVWPNVSRYSHRERYREVLKTGQPFQARGVEHRFPDGTRRIFSVQARRIEWKEEFAVLVIMWDVTEQAQQEGSLREAIHTAAQSQKAAEQALQAASQAQRAAEASEERERARAAELEAVMDAVPIYMWITHDPQSREMTGNPTAFALMHMQKGENLSKTGPDAQRLRDFKAMRAGQEIPPEQLPIQLAASSGKPVRDYEFDVVFGDGETLHLFGNAEPLLDENNRPAGAVGAFVDITEQVRLIHALEEFDRKYRDLIQYAPAAIYEVDFRRRCFTSVNDAMCELSGYSREELLSMSPFALLDAESQRTFQNRIEQWLAGEKPDQNVVYRVRVKDGRMVDVVLNVAFSRDEQGNPVGATVVGFDITRQKQAEQALRESQQQNELLANMLKLSSQPFGVGFLDGHTLLVNQALERLTGYTAAELQTTDWGKTLTPPEDVGLKEKLSELLRAGQSVRYEKEYLRKDGTRVPVEMLVHLVSDAQGSPQYYYSFITDISERKQAEKELRESNERLAALTEAAVGLLAGVDPAAHLSDFFQHFSNRLGLDVYVQYNLAPDGTHLELGSWAGFPEKYRRLLERLELGQAVCGTVAQARKPMYVDDIQASTGRKTQLIRELGVNTFACHPLMVGDRLLGTLSFGSRRLNHFEPDTIELLRAFCNLVAMAINRKRMEEELHTASRHEIHIELQHRLLEQREQERIQIARDLHDGPVQEILGAVYALQGIQFQLECSHELVRQVAEVQAALTQQLAVLRSYAGELRPPSLSKFGLGKAIKSHLETYQEKHPELFLTFKEEQVEDALSEEVRLALFRIYQECLTNVAKHARATRVMIRLEKTPAETILEIQDDGVGFEVPQEWLELARQGHLGLVGIRERTEAIGGALEIASRPGEGTSLRVSVPHPGAG